MENSKLQNGKNKENRNEEGKPRVVVRRVKKSRNFHDPWVGTDTTGPGEAVSVIGGVKFEGVT